MNLSNNETNEPFFNCAHNLFKDVFKYLGRVIEFGTIVTSILSIIVFWRIIRNELIRGQMFKHLMVAAIVELFYFINSVAIIGFECEGCGNSYAWQIWFNWIYYYLNICNMTASNYFEVAAAFDCYIMITNKLKCFQTDKSFKIIVSIFLIFSFALNFYSILGFEMIKENVSINVNNFTIESIIYYTIATSFFFTKTFGILNKFAIVSREILPIVFLIILNVLIMLTLRRVMKNKHQLHEGRNNTNHETNNNNTIPSAIRTNRSTTQAEINKLKMVIIICFNYILLRIPFVVNMTPNFNGTIWFCQFYQSSLVFYNLSYFMKFIIFFCFNKHFKKHFKSIFKL
jgi:hypothetical protein